MTREGQADELKTGDKINAIVDAAYLEMAGQFAAESVRTGAIPSVEAIRIMAMRPAVTAHLELKAAGLVPLSEVALGLLIFELVGQAFQAHAVAARLTRTHLEEVKRELEMMTRRLEQTTHALRQAKAAEN